MQHHDFVPDLITHRAAISACGKGAGSASGTYFPFHALQHQAIVPDAITHSAAISACEKGQQCQQATP